MNYYAVFEYCPHCKRGRKEHIGKLNYATRFMFQASSKFLGPMRADIFDYENWLTYVGTADHIESEEGEIISLSDLLALIDETKDDRSSAQWVIDNEGHRDCFRDDFGRDFRWSDFA